MRSSRVKMRSRPIVTSVPLPIVPTDVDNDDDAEDVLLLQPPPHSTSISIPTPPITYSHDFYQRFQYPPYHPPHHYIKFHLSTPASLYSAYDHYDLLSEDMDWLASYNADPSHASSSPLTADHLEALMDLFEKDSGVITLRGDLMSPEDKIDVSRYYTLAKAIMSAATSLHLKGKAMEAAYHYWIDKRKRLGKALLRIFQEPPPKGNLDPHVAFRPRLEGRRISKRNPRKDDISAYQKMLVLKKDFARVIDIVDTIVMREREKLQALLLDVQIFDERLSLSYHVTRMQPMAAQLVGWQVANPLAGLMNAATKDVSVVSLFRSTLPLSTWIRPEKKKVKKPSKPLLPPPSIKRSSTKLKTKKDSGLPPLSSTSPAISSLSSLTSSPPHPDLYDELADYSSSDDLLSEDDDDRYYFQQIEHSLKRARLNLPPVMLVEAAFPDEDVLPPSELITPPPGVAAVLGRCRGRVGRGGTLWIDPVVYVNVGRGAGSAGLKMEGGAAVVGLQSEDHASATSFSPYPSVVGGGGVGVGDGDGAQAMHVDVQPTPTNVKELQHGAASVQLDFPVPINVVQ